MKRLPTYNFLLTVALFVIPAAAACAEDAILLFDGQSLDGWTTMDGKPVSGGWEVVDGTLHLAKSETRAGNILTDKEYENFDLQFEWKIAPGGNNGLKYRVRKYGNRVLGCEYQILDDSAYVERLRPKGLTGSLYDVYEPTDMHAANPVGEFNHSRIIVQGPHIQHWLNGKLIVSAFVGSRQWRDRIAASKFADFEGFGENRVGKIMLTDHNSEVWYRKMLLKPLPPPQLAVAAPPPRRVPVCGFRLRILRRLPLCRLRRH
jgi:hypothetical protein